MAFNYPAIVPGNLNQSLAGCTFPLLVRGYWKINGMTATVDVTDGVVSFAFAYDLAAGTISVNGTPMIMVAAGTLVQGAGLLPVNARQTLAATDPASIGISGTLTLPTVLGDYTLSAGLYMGCGVSGGAPNWIARLYAFHQDPSVGTDWAVNTDTTGARFFPTTINGLPISADFIAPSATLNGFTIAATFDP